MRASTAVGLLFAGSMSIFGIFSSNRHSSQAQGIEPLDLARRIADLASSKEPNP